ncbi:MAG: uncharacterized protein H6Q05_3655 [Acidobacteria bacterium]|nr:uncharacterized protein [Acidobacteriota bacterium]
MNDLQLLQTVVATVDRPDDQILAGDIGTIVDLYTQMSIAYEVEFSNADGSVRALVTLAPGQIRRLTPADILTTRPSQSAG